MKSFLYLIIAAVVWTGAVAAVLWNELPGALLEREFNSTHQGEIQVDGLDPVTGVSPLTGRFSVIRLRSPSGKILLEARDGTFRWDPFSHTVNMLNIKETAAHLRLDHSLRPSLWYEALSPRGDGETSGTLDWKLGRMRTSLRGTVFIPLHVYGRDYPVTLTFPPGPAEITLGEELSAGFMWKGISVDSGVWNGKIPLFRAHLRHDKEEWDGGGRLDLWDGSLRFSASGNQTSINSLHVRAVGLRVPVVPDGVLSFEVRDPLSPVWRASLNGPSWRVSASGRAMQYRLHVTWQDLSGEAQMSGRSGSYSLKFPLGGKMQEVGGSLEVMSRREIRLDAAGTLPDLGPLRFQGTLDPVTSRLVGLAGGQGFALTLNYIMKTGAISGMGEISGMKAGDLLVKKGSFSLSGTTRGTPDVTVDVRHASVAAAGRDANFSGSIHVSDKVTYTGIVGICGGVLRVSGRTSPIYGHFRGHVGLGVCSSGFLRGRASVRGTFSGSRLKGRLRTGSFSVSGAVFRDLMAHFEVGPGFAVLEGHMRDSLFEARVHDGMLQFSVNASSLRIPVPGGDVGVSMDLTGLADTRRRDLNALRRLSGYLIVTDVNVPAGQWWLPLVRGSGMIRFDTTVRGVNFSGSWSSVDTGKAVPMQVTGWIRQGKAHLEASFTRLPLHRYMNLHGVRAWAVGRLVIDSGTEVEARLVIRGLMVNVPDRTGKMVVIRNKGPIKALWRPGEGLMLSGRLSLLGQNVEISGMFRGNTGHLHATGYVDASVLTRFLPLGRWISSMSGRVGVDLSFTGPLRSGTGSTCSGDGCPKKSTGMGNIRDNITGSLRLNSIRIRTRHGLLVRVPSGTVKIGKTLMLQDIRAVIADRELMISGMMSPASAKIRLKGRASLSVIPELMPDVVAHAGGSAYLDLTLRPWGPDSGADGSFTVTDAELAVRGMVWPIRISSLKGTVSGRKISIQHLKGTFMGGILSASGTADLSVADRPSFDMAVSLKDFHYERRGEFYADANMSIRLYGRVPDAVVTGHMDLIDGRYYRKVDIIRRILTFHRVHEESEPFWKSHPQFGATSLDVEISNSGRLKVVNNVADLDLAGSLHLGGTLASPLLSGRILVTGGTFSIPFLKGTYSVDEGDVELTGGQSPFLKLTGETQVDHYSGESFTVRLMLEGPFDSISFKLRSNPPLEQGQILMLLASGRTVEDFRQSYRPDPQSGTTTTTSTMNPIEIYDAPIKQVTGDFLSNLVSSPIRSVTRLDLLRLELGADSIQVRMAKRLGKHLTLKGEAEFGLMGRSRQEASVEVKLHDRVYIDSKLRRYIPDDETYQYEDRLQGRVQMRYMLDLKGSLADMLGL